MHYKGVNLTTKSVCFGVKKDRVLGLLPPIWCNLHPVENKWAVYRLFQNCSVYLPKIGL